MANLVDTSVNGDLRVTGTMFGTQAGNYATCATAAATAAKAVTISGFTLTTGIHVFVKFTVTNTAAVASLTLNVSGTGAKAMKYRGGNLPAVGTLSASRVYEFIYDGTNWELVGDLDTNTQTVTGVKGNAESSYRTGQVNLTAANIGASASDHTHGNIGNGGTLTDTAAAAAGNDYVVIRDADNAKIQTSTIKGTDVADAVSKKHSHSTLTLSTTAQAYDGSHTLALPSTDPYTSARTPASHTHGNITNGGALQANDITIASGDKLVVTDSSDSNKVARASLAFDGATTNQMLSKKGEWSDTIAKARAVVDYGATTKAIEIGWSGAAVTSPAYFAVYTDSANGYNKAIKDCSLANVKKAINGTSVGSTAVPVFINANGAPQVCTDDFVHDGDVTSTYSSTGTAPVNGTAVAAAIGGLDVSSVGGDGKYISAISETDGKISATATTMDTTPTASSTKAVTSGGIKTALDGKVSKAGDTMTGRLTLEKPLSQVLIGTGTAGSSSSGTYYPAKWKFDLGIATPTAGDQLVIKMPTAGHDYGVYMSTDNGTTYFPVARHTGATRLSTHYPNGAYIHLVYEAYVANSSASGQVDSIYPLAGGTARVSQKIGCWRVINDYDSGNDYECVRTGNGRFYTGSTGCNPYTLVCLDSAGKYSMLISAGSGTGTSKTINTAGKFKLGAVILYHSANRTVAANTLIGDTYNTYIVHPNIDTRYSHNHTTTFTANSPLYIECTIDSDGYWSPTTKCITQVLETGKYYIYLGQTYSTEYQVSLAPSHPLYYYDGTNLTERPRLNNDDRTKLDGISAGANKVEASSTNGKIKIDGTDTTVYTHPTTEGNKHIPSGGSSGQFLGYDSAGTAKWVNNPNSDTKVTQTKDDNGATAYPLLMAGAADPNGTATTARYDSGVKLTPSTNTISANISGNAATANSAGKLTTARKAYVTLGTASTTTTVDWSADPTTIPVDGTLAVSHGGTGMTTSTNVNAVVIGNSTTATSAMQTVRTGNGAFYATAQDAKPTFGTLPIDQGGTGATTRLNALKKLTDENVGTNATYFLTITNSWGKGGYTSVADAKTVLGLGSAAYTASTNYAPSSTISCTTANVKTALGTGSGTAKYLREDGTWQTPVDSKVRITVDSSAATYKILATAASSPTTNTDSQAKYSASCTITGDGTMGAVKYNVNSKCTLQFDSTNDALDFVFA